MATKDQHQGVDISPATLKDGTLLAALDPVINPGTQILTGQPRTGVAKTGNENYGGTGEKSGRLSPRPVD